MDTVTNTGEEIIFPENSLSEVDLPFQEGTNDLSNATTVIVNDNLQPALPDKNVPEEEHIIGSDNRVRVTSTTKFPNSAVVHIQATFSNGKTYIGSGNMISSTSVLTAGHVVYNKDMGWAVNVQVFPGVNGSKAPYGTTSGKKLLSVKGWTEENSSEYDVGLIRLDKPLGYNTGWFGLSSVVSVGMGITTTGYPGDKAAQTMWTNSGVVQSFTENNVYYELDTVGGQSGSPVYNAKNQVIATHAYGANTKNFGTRMNNVIYNWIQSDINSSIGVYRVYNPNSGAHFFTIKDAEVLDLEKLGWRYECTAWFSPSIGDDVHRLYNPSNGGHFFTSNTGEKDNLVKAGWRYEGVSWKSNRSKTAPVYRVYNPNGRSGYQHHYTYDVNEKNNLVKSGWKDEGIAWYGL
ncbi:MULTISPECIES: trypsin-like serine protease [unclassified Enterococcus]|uniref:trypsin-like peptidase domain-containing protein n=1 Tax=unclassified Enterococcus TaxID=2608891 RepID=UPI002476DAE9|nr:MULTISPECIES: trypsin-like serine protease [unclassified Enterococcus]